MQDNAFPAKFHALYLLILWPITLSLINFFLNFGQSTKAFKGIYGRLPIKWSFITNLGHILLLISAKTFHISDSSWNFYNGSKTTQESVYLFTSFKWEFSFFIFEKKSKTNLERRKSLIIQISGTDIWCVLSLPLYAWISLGRCTYRHLYINHKRNNSFHE